MDYNRTDVESLVRKILLEELAGKRFSSMC